MIKKISSGNRYEFLAQGCLLGQLSGAASGSLAEFGAAEEIRLRYPDGVRGLVSG